MTWARSSLGRLLCGAHLIVLGRVKLESSIRSLHLLPQPPKLALGLVLPGSLNHPRVCSDSLAWKLLAVETDLKSAFYTTLAYFAIGISISPSATSMTNQPGVVLTEELQSLSEFTIVKLLRLVWHPVLIPLCIHPFSQKSNEVPEFGVTTPSRTGFAIATTVRNQVFFFHKILL